MVIPREDGKTSNTEDVLFFGLTKFNVVGEGTTNLTLNISFDAARIVPKVEKVMKEEKDLGEDEYVVNLSDVDDNNNEKKINPIESFMSKQCDFCHSMVSCKDISQHRKLCKSNSNINYLKVLESTTEDLLQPTERIRKPDEHIIR